MFTDESIVVKISHPVNRYLCQTPFYNFMAIVFLFNPCHSVFSFMLNAPDGHWAT